MSEFKEYQRAKKAELRTLTEDELNQSPSELKSKGISVSDVDAKNGSPKKGDMIARNPENHEDKWLVSKKYFEDNFEEADDEHYLKIVLGLSNPIDTPNDEEKFCFSVETSKHSQSHSLERLLSKFLVGINSIPASELMGEQKISTIIKDLESINKIISDNLSKLKEKSGK